MSSATPSHSTPTPSALHTVARTWLDRFAAGVRAAAFWTAALLPLAVFAALLTGIAGHHPMVLAGALALAAVSAVVGHGHSPNR